VLLLITSDVWRCCRRETASKSPSWLGGNLKRIRVTLARALFESYGGELHFLAEFFWVVDSSSVYEYGFFHVFCEVFWFEFLEFVSFCYENAAVYVLEALDG